MRAAGFGLAVLALLALWGCAPGPAGGYRDPAAPISSQGVVDQGRLSGRWIVVDGYADVPLGAPGQGLQISAMETGLTLSAADGQVWQMQRRAPGRYVAAQGGPELWLLWADADYRIAVLGNPDGTLGFVMMRQGAAGSGLRQAAREIFAWQGYDPARLITVSR